MFPATYNIGYYRGDSYEFVVNPKNADQSVFNLTDYSALFTIARSTGSQSSFTASAVPIINVNAGTITCRISPEVGSYFSAPQYLYDLEIRNSTTASNVLVYTLLRGAINVTQDIGNTSGA